MTGARYALRAAHVRRLLLSLGVVAIAVAALATLPRAAARNVAWVSLLPQIVEADWSAWGLGLRVGQVRDVTSMNGESSRTRHDGAWSDRSRLGVGRTWQMATLESSLDCQSQRLSAQLLMRSADWEGAARLLEGTVRECPHLAFANLELGLAYDRLFRPQQAIRAFERGGVTRFARDLASANYSTLALECIARQTDARGDVRGEDAVRECVPWLTRAQQLTPRHPWIEWQLARLRGNAVNGSSTAAPDGPLWRDTRLIRLAVEAYTAHAEQQGAPLSESLVPLARRYALAADLTTALWLHELVQRAEPGSPRAHYLSGLAAAATGDWTTASRSLQQALTLAPGEPNIVAAAARARARLQERDSALSLYRQALLLEQCIPEAWDFIEAAGEAMATATGATAATLCRRRLTVQYEGEESPSSVGEVRAATNGGAVVMAGKQGFVTFGPGIKLPPGRYTVTFRVQAPRGTRGGCVRLDVSAEGDIVDGTWLSNLPSRYVPAHMLIAGHFVEQTLLFDFVGGTGVEFRVLESCGREVYVDWIRLTPAGAAASSMVSSQR